MVRPALVCLCLLLVACGDSKRPEGVHCAAPGGDGRGTLGEAASSPQGYPFGAADYLPFQESAPSPGMSLSETAPPARFTVHASNEVFRNKLSKLLTDRSRDTVNVLTISAGGEMGAFAVGFLNGLAARNGGGPNSRLTYDVVTGVSTGALIAPLAFAGRSEDLEALKDQYTNISDRDLVSKRSKLGALFSNSLYTTEKLRDRIADVITPDFMDELARIARDEGRVLAVMAVDLDSGWPRIFDLTAIAAGEGSHASRTPEDRLNRIIDAILASAAIPIAFPPVFIDKNAHVDGGARSHLFIGSAMAVAAAASEEPESRRPELGLETFVLSGPAPGGPKVRVDVLVNGDYRIPPACTDNTLTGVAERSFSVIVNQMLYDSVHRLVVLARMLTWDVRVADAREVVSPPGASAGETEGCRRPAGSDDLFNRPFMACVYEKACALAFASPRPWKTEMGEILPRSFALEAPTDLPERCTVKPSR